MDNFTLVRPEHLNHYGFLFGGQLLKWVDEHAWLVATRDFPGCSFVTVAMDKIAFRQQVENGSILRFHIVPQRIGTSSARYAVEVFGAPPGGGGERRVFTTTITFVNVSSAGRKTPIPQREPLYSEVPPETAG